jgi:hypothetical protein
MRGKFIMNNKFYAVPVNLQLGEGFRVREFENEEKLTSFLRNVKPNDYMLIEGQKIKANKREVIDIIRPEEEVEEE